MLTKRLPKIAALLIVITSLLAGCMSVRDLQPPGIELAGVQIHGLDTSMSLRSTARIQLFNPNLKAMKVVGGNIALQLDGIELATSKLQSGFTIPSNGNIIVDVPVRFKLADSLKFGLNMLSSNRTRLGYRLSGHVDLGVRYLGRIKINEAGEIDVFGDNAGGSAR